ncbi:hypothetical protein CVT26_000561 [Gymnopilus dilepis]|uniref:F-box domain-containing protein n=1 Tax=Gymnopilus dilepis TaxID=231916 RepID=A0A409VH84_9AGAR|nr:hypothetical protein CVT26_000561 [Gymnopilus dilepis]
MHPTRRRLYNLYRTMMDNPRPDRHSSERADRGMDPPVWVTSFVEIINILNHECTRWRSLDLSLPKELLSRFDFAKSNPAVLQELKLDSPTGEVLDIQALELVAVRNLDVSSPMLNLVNLNFTNTTAITLRSVALDQIIYILESVPRLLACRLQNVTMRAVEEPRRAYHHVVHSKLRSLEFKCGYRNPMTIVFDALTLPALQHLQLEYLEEGRSISSIVSFLRRSSNSVKSLSLNMTKITGKDLVLLLRATPSLQDLNLTHSPMDAENLFDLAEALTSHLSTSENIFLPFLQTFDWFGDVGFPWTFLPSLFAPLLPNDNTPGRPLQKVKIYCNLCDEPYEVPYVDEDILAQLSKFSDQVHFRFGMPLEYDVADLWEMSLDKWRHPTRDEEVCVV